MGGLGIKKIEDMNKDLVTKMSWDIVKNADKLWVKVFQKKYVKNRNFMKIPMLKSASWFCQSIFGCRDVLKNGLCHCRVEFNQPCVGFILYQIFL